MTSMLELLMEKLATYKALRLWQLQHHTTDDIKDKPQLVRKIADDLEFYDKEISRVIKALQ